MRPADLMSSRREKILGAAARHGMRDLRVFWSVARGESRSGSDLDLLVNVAPGQSLLDLVAFWQEVEDILGRQVDVISDGGVSPYLREKVYAEPVPL